LAVGPEEEDQVVESVGRFAPATARTTIKDVTSAMTETEAHIAFDLREVSVAYGKETVIAGVSMAIVSHAVTALIGPSGCGKSTLLRCLNRMNDEIGNVTVGGMIALDGRDIYAAGVDPVEIRSRVGQVFQKPNPFPMSIYDNVVYGPKTLGVRDRGELDEIVEHSLKRAALWSEVKDSLKKHAFELSGGQQQRLCIARALATEPEVLLMDEPASALDPISSQQIEDTIAELRQSVTIVIVTHNMQQAGRVADSTAFMLRESMEEPAHLVEYGATRDMFTCPGDRRTEAYISGQFG
jgi:phosphate transport system ATP-binding protein